MGVKRFQDERKQVPDKLRNGVRRLWKLYIEKYFHDDPNLWSSRKQPYIFYKHMFRKYLYSITENYSYISELEKDFDQRKRKTHHSTLINSVKQDPQTFPFTQKELTGIIKFLNKHTNLDLQSEIKTKIKKAKNMGYTTDDIARHCLVHEDVIYKVLEDKKVPLNILNQMKKELQ